MIIRRLFGAAFSGSSLTNKAISPTSPYMGDEILEAVATNIDDLIPIRPFISIPTHVFKARPVATSASQL